MKTLAELFDEWEELTEHKEGLEHRLEDCDTYEEDWEEHRVLKERLTKLQRRIKKGIEVWLQETK